MTFRKRISEWVCFLVNPGNQIYKIVALVVAFGVLAALSHWRDLWMAPKLDDWLRHQDNLTRGVIYAVIPLVIYFIAYIYFLGLFVKIHYALDPAFETERAQKRAVKEFKVGDRVQVGDRTGQSFGKIVSVDDSGESFAVEWEEDGHRVTLLYQDIDVLKRAEEVAIGDSNSFTSKAGRK